MGDHNINPYTGLPPRRDNRLKVKVRRPEGQDEIYAIFDENNNKVSEEMSKQDLDVATQKAITSASSNHAGSVDEKEQALINFNHDSSNNSQTDSGNMSYMAPDFYDSSPYQNNPQRSRQSSSQQPPQAPLQQPPYGYNNPVNPEGAQLSQTSMILGILSLFFAGIILGPIAMSKAKKAQLLGVDATVGKVTGILGLIFGILGTLYILFIIIVVIIAGSAEYYNYGTDLALSILS